MPELWKLLAIAVLCLALGACGSLTPPGTRSDTVYYTVKPGDTLYGIAFHYGYDHREVAAWNNIDPPYRIYAGQTLAIIPPHSYRVKDGADRVTSAVASQNSSRAASGNPHAVLKKSPVLTPASLEKTTPKRQGKIDWHWPTLGKITTFFNLAKSEKGIDVSGKTGQAVWAAAGGEVVYSGKGLIGYGNLIIIKHDDLYLSAYGHNRRLLVKEGDRVERGQQIAEMGTTSKDGPILHFEIRKNGKPVDPMHYLP